MVLPCDEKSIPECWIAERENQMPVIVNSSLGRGLISGRVKRSEIKMVEEIIDAFSMRGYSCRKTLNDFVDVK